MAVIPGEVFVTGVDPARLLEETRKQNLPVSHVRKVEHGYMVPATVRAAFQKKRAPARSKKRASRAREVDF